MKMKTVDKNYFPGWVRKSIAFTIDDGNIPLDKKFIDIVKPAGIKGTFNIGSPKLDQYTPEFYREFYRGYGISNHCKLHPFYMTPERESIPLSDEVFDGKTADKSMRYRTNIPGVYKVFHNGRYWANVATPEAYCKLVDEGKRDIEAVFGEGSITTYVWPYSEQSSEEVRDYVINRAGYMAVRKTGATRDSSGFNMPADRGRWSYNTGYSELADVSKLYEAYPDDGELKFFCFGVHSHDFENNNCWDVLVDFADSFGNRPETYYYASVEEIFTYEDAVKAVIVTDEYVENPTEITLYITIDGKRATLEPHSRISLI